ncbi:MAG: VOC family protein [Pseudohongiellaceae bacterium]
MIQANPINVTQIDHVVIRAKDIEAMVSFYQEVLGFRLERGPAANGLAQLRAGTSLIDLVDMQSMLGKEGGDNPDPKAPNMDHVCFQVMPWDADKIIQHLNDRGVQCGAVSSRYGAQGQGPSIYLSDPEGNRIELKGQSIV